MQCAKLTNSKNKHRPVLLPQKNIQSNEKEGLISYLKSLKNYSISFMSDFNRVSHISGGLIFRLYRRSTFVTCQIIFPPACQNHLSWRCCSKLPTAPRLTESDLAGFLFGRHIYGNVTIIQLCTILNAIHLSLDVFKQISGRMIEP